MSSSDYRKQAPAGRRALFVGVFVAGAGLLGAALARPLVNAFRGASPWILPTIAVGVLTVLVVCALLLPLLRTRRR